MLSRSRERSIELIRPRNQIPVGEGWRSHAGHRSVGPTYQSERGPCALGSKHAWCANHHAKFAWLTSSLNEPKVPAKRLRTIALHWEDCQTLR